MTFNMMEGDEQARKDRAEQLKAMKERLKLGEEMPHLPQNISELKIPDALVDDVVRGMFGPAACNGQRIAFINGPWDGEIESMKSTPAVFQVKLTASPLFGINNGRVSNVAVSVFYDVAVYDLVVMPDTRDGAGRVFYRFAGFSQCMEGLQMREPA